MKIKQIALTVLGWSAIIYFALFFYAAWQIDEMKEAQQAAETPQDFELNIYNIQLRVIEVETIDQVSVVYESIFGTKYEGRLLGFAQYIRTGSPYKCLIVGS